MGQYGQAVCWTSDDPGVLSPSVGRVSLMQPHKETSFSFELSVGAHWEGSGTAQGVSDELLLLTEGVFDCCGIYWMGQAVPAISTQSGRDPIWYHILRASWDFHRTPNQVDRRGPCPTQRWRPFWGTLLLLFFKPISIHSAAALISTLILGAPQAGEGTRMERVMSVGRWEFGDINL